MLADGKINDPEPAGCMSLDVTDGSTPFEELQSIKDLSVPSSSQRLTGLADARAPLAFRIIVMFIVGLTLPCCLCLILAGGLKALGGGEGP